MPLMSMQVDSGLWSRRQAELLAILPEVRQMLCAELSVPVEVCHLTFVPVHGMADQALGSIDLRVLEKPDRPIEQVRRASGRLRDLMSAAAGTPIAVRVTLMDPARYYAQR